MFLFPNVSLAIDVVPALLGVSLLTSAATLWRALSVRPIEQFPALWAVATTAIASGLMLLAFRGKIPNVFSMLGGNCVLLAGVTLLSFGVNSLAGRNAKPDLVIGGAVIAAYSAAFLSGAGIHERTSVYLVSILILFVRLLYGCVRLPRTLPVKFALAGVWIVYVMEGVRLLLLFTSQLGPLDPAFMTSIIVRLSVAGVFGISATVMVVYWSREDLVPAEPTKDSTPDEPVRSWRLAADRNALIAPDGSELRLTGNEFVVLQRLGGSADPVDRLTLNALIGRDTDNPKDRGIDILLSRLRKKCADIGVELPVTSVRGRGYVFHGDLPQV